MKRRIRQLLWAVSLLLFISVSILWIRSYYSADSLSVCREKYRWHFHVFSVKGTLALCYTTSTVAFGESSFRFHATEPFHVEQLPGTYQLAGFSYSDMTWLSINTIQQTSRHRTFACPHLALVILTAILPALSLRRFSNERKRLRAKNVCPHCGYDLRATPNLCPECGHAKHLEA